MDNGQRVVAGRYRLLTRLGAGGMGTVWRAEDLVLGRDVAVKEITFPPGLSDDDREVLRERTRREARAAARLDSPSAVTVFDVVEQDGAPFLVMELVEARTLAEVVRADGPLSPQRTAQVGLELLGALESAHARGILHRDVKPSNVLVRDDGRVVLTDFGIATTTGDPSITSTGLLLGSPAYLSPERARGEPPGPPADLWSLGATLFTAVEGRPPYDRPDALLTVAAVVSSEHTPFVAAGPLEPVLEGLLTKDPELRLNAAGARPMLRSVADRADRPTAPTATATLPLPDPQPAAARTTALHVGDVRRQVAEADGRPAPSRPAPGPREPLPRPPRPRPAPAHRRSRLPLAAAAALLLVAGGSAVALLVDGDPDRPPTAGAGPDGLSPAPDPSPTAPGVDPSEVDDGAAPTDPEPTDAEPTSPEPTDDEPTDVEPAEPEQGPEPEPEPEPVPGQAVPAGWTTDTGTAGWTVAVPPGYTETRPGEYRQAGTGRTLRIETGTGRPDAVADRREQADGFAQRHPTYRELRIERVPYGGFEAADWEFTYEGLHVLNRVFVVDGTGHSLWLQAPQGDAADARADFDAIAAAFRPVGR